MKPKISPSILSADFGKLNSEIKEVEKYSDSLHIDVMDGHFVPNISFGAPIVKSIKTKLPKDCHLMISDPIKYSKDFAPYVDRIFFHAEIFEHDLAGLKKAIKEIKKLNIKVGLAINPDKSVNLVMPALKDVDAILVMSVYAGFGGQKFMPNILKKIKALRNFRFIGDIIIDGGIDKNTIKLAKDAGANIFVAGTSIFGKKDRVKAIKELRDAI